MNESKPVSVPVSLRLSLDLVNKIKLLASQDERSFNNYVERLLKKSLSTHPQP